MDKELQRIFKKYFEVIITPYSITINSKDYSLNSVDNKKDYEKLKEFLNEKN
jgi:hypothetical protein